MPSAKVIFIHGNGTMRWSVGWAPWLKVELDKLGLETCFETFPDSILARREYWLPFLKDYLKADENTLLIGWSSGAVAAMRYAEQNKIFGSILIAPCATDLGLESEKISGWYDGPWRWDKIRQNQKQIAMFYSQNDEFIPLDELRFVREKIKPDLVYEFTDKGHFLRQETFPELLEAVKKILRN